ncbi:MAG: GxxExxY protein [Verrucomicrobia bacterium]|nr:GxxExxY protein [Verrucomicrobiota bacterium]
MNPKYDLAGNVIGLAMKVHRTLGPGFLESVYRNALACELTRNGFKIEAGKPIQVHYEDIVVGDFKADLFVNDELIVELKAVEHIVEAHEVQTVNYLTAIHKDSGLLLNFGATSLEFKRKYRTLDLLRQHESERTKLV